MIFLNQIYILSSIIIFLLYLIKIWMKDIIFEKDGYLCHASLDTTSIDNEISK